MAYANQPYLTSRK